MVVDDEFLTEHVVEAGELEFFGGLEELIPEGGSDNTAAKQPKKDNRSAVDTNNKDGETASSKRKRKRKRNKEKTAMLNNHRRW